MCGHVGRKRVTRAYIGIDPGLSGAVALLCDGEAFVWDIPSVVVKNTRRDYLARGFADLVLEACLSTKTSGSDIAAVIESPIAMPRQASNTTLKQGMGFGLALGICASLGFAYEMVPPAKWKKAMGISPGSDKGASRVMASQMFPALAPQLARVKDDGRAEALLLAEYRRRLG